MKMELLEFFKTIFLYILFFVINCILFILIIFAIINIIKTSIQTIADNFHLKFTILKIIFADILQTK